MGTLYAPTRQRLRSTGLSPSVSHVPRIRPSIPSTPSKWGSRFPPRCLPHPPQPQPPPQPALTHTVAGGSRCPWSSGPPRRGFPAQDQTFDAGGTLRNPIPVPLPATAGQMAANSLVHCLAGVAEELLLLLLLSVTQPGSSTRFKYHSLSVLILEILDIRLINEVFRRSRRRAFVDEMGIGKDETQPTRARKGPDRPATNLPQARVDKQLFVPATA
ncbi:predicted protein [Histoplasma capsulatum G186AR]|uniref:Uncharacterized protein n=1 Tax=Ajellomyces capsulatus (strain G186AR / H82 / ATCC MYA-2454 / RMSCC 2432) TaxID=447093 RepID=C0P0B6_AJECG|nr:uncharacterized protein HCBG_08835 [Histoplasma capsulatum G186AR]EEH02932.1 predicted protein [Histoplasma capsulatum G186AR]